MYPVDSLAAPSLSCRSKGPLCVIIQNPVNNAKRDANLLYQIRATRCFTLFMYGNFIFSQSIGFSEQLQLPAGNTVAS